MWWGEVVSMLGEGKQSKAVMVWWWAITMMDGRYE